MGWRDVKRKLRIFFRLKNNAKNHNKWDYSRQNGAIWLYVSKSSCAGQIWHHSVMMEAAYDSVMPIHFDPPTSAMRGTAAACCQTQHNTNIFPHLTITDLSQDCEVTCSLCQAKSMLFISLHMTNLSKMVWQLVLPTPCPRSGFIFS